MPRSGRARMAAALAVCAVVAVGGASAQADIHACLWDAQGIHDLGAMGCDLSLPSGINAAGQVVGVAMAGALNHAFLWDAAGGMRDLAPGQPQANALSISDAGQVLVNTSGGYQLWDSAHGLQPCGFPGTPYALNSGGQIIGLAFSGGHNTACIWDSVSGLRGLGDLGGGWGEAHAINNAGQVVGQSYTNPATPGPTDYHAFLWTSAGGMRDLGTFGTTYMGSMATAISPSGKVAGFCIISNVMEHAFYWDQAGGMIDLGAIDDGRSWAWGVNDSGTVVGTAETAAGRRAFVWDASGGMRLLPGYAGYASQAVGINNAGQVVGWTDFPGRPGDANRDGKVSFADYISLANNFGQSGGWDQGDFNGDGKVTFADYITLANNFGQSAPEPGTLLLLIAGGLAMCRRRPRRK